jgi:hypothetical protein
MIYDGFLPTEREVGTKTFTNHSDKCSQRRSQPPSFIKIPFYLYLVSPKGCYTVLYQLAILLVITLKKSLPSQNQKKYITYPSEWSNVSIK